MAESEQALLHVTNTSSCETNYVKEQSISPQNSEVSEGPQEPRNGTDNTEDCKRYFFLFSVLLISLFTSASVHFQCISL